MDSRQEHAGMTASDGRDMQDEQDFEEEAFLKIESTQK